MYSVAQCASHLFTYLLGLRLLRELLRLLQGSTDQFHDRLKTVLQEQKQSANETELRQLASTFVSLMARICTLTAIKRVSLSVGVEDLAQAYKAVLGLVGTNNASELIDLSIKLDHFAEVPLEQIHELHKRFIGNAFANTILADLVTAYMMTFEVDRRTRQSMTSLFNIKPNIPGLADPTRKKILR